MRRFRAAVAAAVALSLLIGAGHVSAAATDPVQTPPPPPAAPPAPPAALPPPPPGVLPPPPGGAAAAPPSGGMLKGMTLQDIDATMGAVEGIADIIGSWVGPKPPARPEFSFADTRSFDMQLHESLLAKLARVNVIVDGRFGADAMPERISNWLGKIRKTGGTVGECVLRPEGSRGFLFFLELVLKVLQVVDAWRLYQPASAYNAVVLVNEQGRQVKNIVFEERSQPGLTCPGGERPRVVP